MTQYFDTLMEIGPEIRALARTNAILIPHSPPSSRRPEEQTLNAMVEADQVVKPSKIWSATVAVGCDGDCDGNA